MNAPAIVSGGGDRALGQGGRADVADADLEERRRESGLDLVGIEVELVGPDADEPHIEDEVGVAPSGGAYR